MMCESDCEFERKHHQNDPILERRHEFSERVLPLEARDAAVGQRN